MDVSQPLKWASVNDASLVTIECDEHVNRISKFVVMFQRALASLQSIFSNPWHRKVWGTPSDHSYFRTLKIEHNGNNATERLGVQARSCRNERRTAHYPASF
jgi:hypothetical protein